MALDPSSPHRHISSPRPKVVFILGFGRSGSTLLNSLLGQPDGFFAAGELHYLWERGLMLRHTCGCGEPLTECDLWSMILSRAFPHGIEPSEVLKWRREVLRVRHTRRLLRESPHRTSSRRSVERYKQVMTTLYKSIVATTGARLIVDSSKRPSDAALTRLIGDVDPYFVHLVRDPRAVAYSWAHRTREFDKTAEMKRWNALASGAMWVEWNIAASLLRRKVGPDRFVTVRYEDFVDDPYEAVEAIAGMVDEDPRSFPIGEEGRISLNRNHSVSGNPSRFLAGAIELRRDDEWLFRQPRGDRIVATLVTLPLLRTYDYPLFTKRPL